MTDTVTEPLMDLISGISVSNIHVGEKNLC